MRIKTLKVDNIKIKDINDGGRDGGGIEFSDGTTITDYHDQDCCEKVYADWEQLKDTNITEEVFKELKITGKKEAGISINGYFVPCYNDQNGYYGDDLEIIVKRPNKKPVNIDISEYTKDQMN